MTDPNASSKRCWLLSSHLCVVRNEVFSLATAHVVSGGEGYFRPGQVMEHMNKLFSDGTSFDTHQHTEIGRWDRKFDVDLDPMPEVPDDMYYAWANPGYWDYDPPLVIYTKAEFMELFEDCCRNYVGSHPDRREEFAAALAANGMSL